MAKGIKADLTGKKFGLLTVVREEGKNRHGTIKWLCLCDCGSYRHCYAGALNSGDAKTCGQRGSVHRYNRSRPTLISMEGLKFGKWLVLSRVPKDLKVRKTFWLCRCDCGEEKVQDGYHLRKGYTTRCVRCSETTYKWQGTGEISLTYWATIEWRAIHKDQTFEVTIDFAWNLFLKQNRRCALTGELLTFAPQYKVGLCKAQTASLDRIDSKRGYLIDNVQWVHKVVNVMKMHLDQDNFIEWCRKIAGHPKP